MKILLVDDGFHFTEAVTEALQGAGYEVASETDPARLLARVDAFRPDMVLIDTDSPGRDVLEQLCVLHAHNPLPLVMFSNDGSQETIAAATDAGVTVYMAAHHLDIHGLEPILAVATTRFRHDQKLRERLETALRRAEERRQIDTAKGMLMAAKGLSEDEAYRSLQQSAMDHGLSMSAIAERVIKAIA